MKVTFGFVNTCSFFTIWFFNIYSWLVSGVLCSDGVLSVPATKAFSESQTFYNFPYKFLLARFHAASTEATKAETLWLCFVCRLIPYPRQRVVTQLEDNQTRVLPLFPPPERVFAAQLWKFPQDRRELGTWDVFGLLSHLDSTWIYLSKSLIQYFFLLNRLQASPAQGGTFHWPVWIRRSDTLWIVQCQGAGSLSVGPSADLQVCLGPHPACCSACSRGHRFPQKRIWHVLRKKSFWLRIVLESCHKTPQGIKFVCVTLGQCARENYS